MGDPGSYDLPIPIIDGVDDAMVADTNAKIVTARELDCPWRSWLRTQRIDGLRYPITETALQPPVGADGLGV